MFGVALHAEGLHFEQCHALARARQKRRLFVETQDINLPACRLYTYTGYTLVSIDRFAYPTLPDEAQLIWQIDLTR